MNEVQKLDLADDLFPALLSGEKTKTLRWNEGNIVEGYLLFTSSNNPRWKSLVWVTSVRLAPMDKFAPFYHMTPEELQKSMQKHYPDIIKMDAEVLLVDYLSPQQTEMEYGIPKEWQGKTFTKKSDLF